MNPTDLMSDSLSIQEYERQKRETQIEYEKQTAVKYWVLVQAMLLGARDKPKQAILMFRLEKFFKELVKEFPPDGRAKKELMAELE